MKTVLLVFLGLLTASTVFASPRQRIYQMYCGKLDSTVAEDSTLLTYEIVRLSRSRAFQINVTGRIAGTGQVVSAGTVLTEAEFNQLVNRAEPLLNANLNLDNGNEASGFSITRYAGSLRIQGSIMNATELNFSLQRRSVEGEKAIPGPAQLHVNAGGCASELPPGSGNILGESR